MRLPCALTARRAPRLGLVVLQADETIESDFRRLVPAGIDLLTSRVPSGADLTVATIAAMQDDLPAAAALFPAGSGFDAVAYACTSGAAQIGSGRVEALLRKAVETRRVTDPVRALVAACRALGVTRVGLVSPYSEPISARLRDVLLAQGIATPAFGSFEIAEETRVARIDGASLGRAAARVAAAAPVQAVFLSCTNLRTLDVIDGIEADLGLPCLSSNQVLAWDMLSGIAPATGLPGRLGRA